MNGCFIKQKMLSVFSADWNAGAFLAGSYYPTTSSYFNSKLKSSLCPSIFLIEDISNFNYLLSNLMERKSELEREKLIENSIKRVVYT